MMCLRKRKSLLDELSLADTEIAVIVYLLVNYCQQSCNVDDPLYPKLFLTHAFKPEECIFDCLQF